MEKDKIIGRGAEAVIYLENKIVKKVRIPKSYRLPELDKKIINQRTKAEKKILEKTSKIIDVPKLEISSKNNEINMEFIEGEKLSDYLDSYESEEQEFIMFQLGKSIAKIHKEGIIHGDLTTSNMIYSNKKIFIIDFGLSFQNGKYEDKGVDIHLLKQSLEAKHFKNWKTLFREFETGYISIEPKEAQKVFEKMNAIEKRGRYRH